MEGTTNLSNVQVLLFECCRYCDISGFRAILANYETKLNLNCIEDQEHATIVIDPDMEQQNIVPWSGKTLLTYAVERCQYEIVRMLLECGVDCEAEDMSSSSSSNNSTALITACRSCDDGLRMVKLLRHCADCDVNHCSASPYYPRPVRGSLELQVTSRNPYFFSAYSNDSNHVSDNTNAYGHINTNGNSQYYSISPLNVAVEVLDLPLLRYLVQECGAPLTFSHTMTRPVLSVFDQKNHLDLVQFIIESSGGMVSEVFTQVCLIDACRDGYLPRLQFLLRHLSSIDDCRCIYANMSIQQRRGLEQLLFIAASRGHLHILHFLISEVGLNPSIVSDDSGENLLYSANTVVTMKYLLSNYELDVNMQNFQGVTPLMHCCNQGLLDCIRFLVDQTVMPIDWSIRTAKNETLMMLAFTGMHLSVFDYFMFRCYQGAINDLCINSSRTPLMFAVELRAYDTVQHLISDYRYRDAIDVNVQDAEGETALIKAVKIDCFVIAQYLLFEACADLSIKDIYGNDAKIYADDNMFSMLSKWDSHHNKKAKLEQATDCF